MPKKWSKELVVRTIQEQHSLGEKLNSNHVQLNDRNFYQAAVRHFGGWKNAIESAGLDYEQVRIKTRAHPVWSREKIVRAIQRLVKAGAGINSNSVQLHHPRLYGAAIKYLESWQKAVESAGFDYSKVRVYQPARQWTREMIVAAVLARKKVGLPLDHQNVPTLVHAASRVFGARGWAKALRRAGIDPSSVNPRLIWTEERVKKEILRLQRAGIPLNMQFLYKNGYRKLLSGGRTVFGSWGRAIRAAGLRYSKVRLRRKNWWTKKRVLYQIKRLEGAGIRLSSKSIELSPGRSGFFQAALRHFGSWRKAVYATGIDYMKHCRIWSTKAWLEKLTSSDLLAIERRAKVMSERRRKHE